MSTVRRRRVPTVPTGPLVHRPTTWAQERIAAATRVPWAWAGQSLPDYGSPEWLALAEEDPRKLAAALVAAEVERYERESLAERLREEVRQMRRWWLEDEAAGWADVAASLPTPSRPTFSEPVELHDTLDWPVVRRPGQEFAGQGDLFELIRDQDDAPAPAEAPPAEEPPAAPRLRSVPRLPSTAEMIRRVS